MWAALRKNDRWPDSTAESCDPPGNTTAEGGLDPVTASGSLADGDLVSSGSRRSVKAAVVCRFALATSASPKPLAVSGTNRPVSSDWAIRPTCWAWDGGSTVGPDGIGIAGG